MPKSLRAPLLCAITVLMLGCISERQETGKSPQQAASNTFPSIDVSMASTNDKPADAPNVDIFTASGAGDLRALQQHIAAGTNLDVREPAGGGTPLILTTVTGQAEAARLLINSGASLSATNNDGATPLHTAAFFGRPEIVKLLLEAGADVNAKNQRGETPLDTVKGAWTPELQRLYRMIAVMFQLEIDLERIKSARPVVTQMLRERM